MKWRKQFKYETACWQIKPHQLCLKSRAKAPKNGQVDMLKAADRLKATIEAGDYRQLPITDAQGLTYTSVSEVEPKGALDADQTLHGFP